MTAMVTPAKLGKQETGHSEDGRHVRFCAGYFFGIACHTDGARELHLESKASACKIEPGLVACGFSPKGDSGAFPRYLKVRIRKMGAWASPTKRLRTDMGDTHGKEDVR
jgi:hypothetical protein